MACKTSCQLCKRLVISQAVTFAGGVLTINIPAGSCSSLAFLAMVKQQPHSPSVESAAAVIVVWRLSSKRAEMSSMATEWSLSV